MMNILHVHVDRLAVVHHRKGRAYVVGQIHGYSQEEKVKNGPAKPSCPLLDDTFAMTVAFDERDQTCGRHSFRGRMSQKVAGHRFAFGIASTPRKDAFRTLEDDQETTVKLCDAVLSQRKAGRIGT